MNKRGYFPSCLILGLAALSHFAGCAAPQKQVVVAPAYQPNFSYKAANTGQKMKLTIGVLEPQFKGDASMKESQKDPVYKAMLSAMDASFGEMLIAKGFDTKGPFSSLNDMTYPDKKGSELLLYAELGFDVTTVAVNPRQAPADSQFSDLLNSLNKKKDANAELNSRMCDVSVGVSGNIKFIATEPLSNQTMWNKRLDVTKAGDVVPGQRGSYCVSGRLKEASQEVQNARAKAFEVLYQDSMKALDNYISGEEFQNLRSSVKEIRDKKSY
jgi:hypothetical protein